MKHPGLFPLFRFVFVWVFVKGWMQKCITWAHILVFSQTPNIPPPPISKANMSHRLTHYPFYKDAYKPTTHREFYCRVRYPNESNLNFLEWQIVNTTHWLTNSPVLNSQSDPVANRYTLTYRLSYYSLISWETPTLFPTTVQLNLVSGEFWTLWIPPLSLHFGGRRTKQQPDS